MAEITPNPQDVVKKIEKLPMYTFFCQKVIPLAFDESLSYLETLYAFQYFLNNTVIPTVNNNAEAVTELQGLYEELNTYVTDYFTNLDVQEEINNKLASMSQSGELTNLIKDYVDPFIEEQNEDIEEFETTVRTQINDFDSRLRAVASGSPKGTYARIEDLRNANPETGVYVVTANGHLYAWTKDQSGNPVDLGVYQATGLDDETKKSIELSDVLEKNIYKNTTTIKDKTDGYYGDDYNFISSNTYGVHIINVENLDFIILKSLASYRRDLRVFNGTQLIDNKLSIDNIWDNFVFDTRNATEIHIVYKPSDIDDTQIIDICKTIGDDTVTINEENSIHFNNWLNDNFDIDTRYDLKSNLFKVHAKDKIFIRNDTTGVKQLRIFDKNRNLLHYEQLSVTRDIYTNNTRLYNMEDYEEPYYFTYINSDTEGDQYCKVVLGDEADIKDFMISKEDSMQCENFSVKVNYHEQGLTGDTVQDGVTDYDDYGVILLPKNYDPYGKEIPLVIFCQGTGERIGPTTNPINNFGWKYLLSKGYAVMDMNGMATGWGTAQGFPVTNQHYANKYLLQSYKKGYEYVINKYNLKKEVFLLGLSMGGGASLLIAQSNIIPIIAMGDFCPAISVYKQDYMKPWGGTNQQKTIAGQWNFDDWSTTTSFNQQYFLDNIEKIKGYDNLLSNTIGSIENIQKANNNYGNQDEADGYNSLSKIFNVPIKIWHCTDDNTVLYRYSEFFINMIKNANGKAELRNMGTGGHNGGWNKGTVTDTDIFENEVTTSIPMYEYVKFIERYI